MPVNPLIQQLQQQFRSHADQQTKAWFENYLKGQIRYYGLKMPQVHRFVKQWQQENQLSTLSVEAQLQLCQTLIQLPHAEEKFAGILYLQNQLIAMTETQRLLDLCEDLFQKACFFDWSTTDWFTVRVLASIIKKDPHSLARIRSWQQAESLWQRRASIVALRAVVHQEASIPLIQQTIATLVTDSARFIQTGIGWTLSDLSKKFPNAAAIVEQHFEALSKEVIDRHTKYLPQHHDYKKRKRTAS